MKTCWLNRQGRPDCVLFMAGWGMGPDPFEKLAASGPADVFMAYDYRSLDDGDFSPLLDAVRSNARLHLTAWSMGVWAAAWLLQRDSLLASLPFSSTTAIGGTCRPIDDQFGIPQQAFSHLLRNFYPSTLEAFYFSMFDDPSEADFFLRQRPARSLAELKDELRSLGAACLDWPEAPNVYERRIVTGRDRIVPPRSQLRAWGRSNCTVLVLPHFPFYQPAGRELFFGPAFSL